MADSQIVSELVSSLLSKGSVTSNSSSTTDLRVQLGLGCSNNKFSSALSESIREGLVVRRRRTPECLGDSDRPITLEATTHAEKCFRRS